MESESQERKSIRFGSVSTNQILSRGKDKKGTGLGLSIVKEIIQAHDEHINVISTEGVGTEFIFSFKQSLKDNVNKIKNIRIYTSF